ncbi:MAG TPA: ROK family protein [Nocardioides sp.]|jgi:glucokinase|nr:ROK family protein [Nocardioides sp.]
METSSMESDRLANTIETAGDRSRSLAPFHHSGLVNDDQDGLALAVDVGGTTIKAELVDRAGIVVASEQRPTPAGQRARDAVVEVGRALLAQRPDAPVVGAGVVVPGLVDREAGIATYSTNLGWRDLELVRSLGAAWGLPVRIANDVASGGVAEHRLGAGVGTPDLVFVPVGTGIAASIVSGGHLVTGHRGETAEIGHLAVRPGVPCACGRDGCLEAVASASAIARRYTALSGHHVAGADEVASRLGTDSVARQVWQDAVEALADGLAVVSLLVGPALVVVGGGLSRAGDALLDPLRVALRERTPVVHPADVTASALGDRGGVVGAALLARDGWAPES